MSSQPAAIVGIGQTNHKSRRWDVSLGGLVREAAVRALEDAHMTWADIDAVVLGKAPDLFEGVMKPELYLTDALGAAGKPMFRVHTAGSVGGTTGIVGSHLVETGRHRNVLSVAYQKQSEGNAQFALGSGRGASLGAGGAFAPYMRSYIYRTGAPEDIGPMVAVKDRQNAVKNPYAHLKLADISVESVKASPMMWDPVHYLESCPSSDGACAVVFTDQAGGEAAAADGRAPAWVLASAMRSEPAQFPGRDPVWSAGAADCAADVYGQVGITRPREQIDCAELYVPFSWYEPMWLEGHHIAEHGQGWKMVEAGDTALDGSFPVNMSGGVLSSNPIGASGLLRFAEAALQVRGMAGEHQVDGAKIALAQAYGAAAQYFSMWIVSSSLDPAGLMGGATMDEAQVAAFQFTGQDIPWLLEHWATVQPDKPLLVWEPRSGQGRTWTYAQFWADVRSLAAGLAGRGVTKGDKVLIHADNCPETVLAWYACATVGAVGVTTNTRSAASEVTFFVDKTGCVGAITQPRHAALVTEAAPDLGWVVVTDDNGGEAPTADEAAHGFDSFTSLYGDGDALPERERDPLAPAGILFTSGTTSRPKAVVHTHANALWAGRVGPTNIEMTADDTYLIFLPFFHVNAQSWSLWTTLGVGGTVVLQPKFSSSRFWEVVTTHEVTHISIIPFVINAIAGQPIPENSLKIGVFGLVVPELEGMLGFRIVPAWGMTETVTHATTANRWLLPVTRSMGKPTPGYEMLIVDQETGEVCGKDQPGELWVRGTRGIQLFFEYYDNPEAMAKSFTEDGWFKTGDIVRWSEGGSLVYCERDGDLLKVGAENVSAREVEDICRQVPGVADVAVVGRKHPMLDQVAVAFVIRGPAAEGDDAAFGAAIIERCAANLADFKVPREVHVVDEFPRATLDKVAKNKLRDLADELATKAEAEAG